METEDKPQKEVTEKSSSQPLKSKSILALVAMIIVIIGAFGLGWLTAGSKSSTGRCNLANNRGSFRPGNGMMGQGKNFGGGMMGRGFGRNIITGDITKINDNNLTIKINDKEYIAVISTDTTITNKNEVAKQADLKVGQQISVLGQTNSQGQIQATNININ